MNQGSKIRIDFGWAKDQKANEVTNVAKPGQQM